LLLLEAKNNKENSKKLGELEESGEIEDLNGIEGPFDSLQVECL